MAYQDDETGLTSGRPIELYQFNGTYNNYNLTSYQTDIISNGQQYKKAAISRGKLKIATQDQSENAMEVNLPFDHPMVVEYAYQNAPPNLNMTLLRCHETDHNDTVTLWSGKVTGFSVEGRKAKLKVPAQFAYVLEGNAPTPRYQAPCNYVLYDERCGVDPANHQHVTTVVSVVGNIVQLASLPWLSNEGKAGYIFTPNGEQRMIVTHVGTNLTLAYPFSRLEAGDNVTVRMGCDHAFNGDCRNKFNNEHRFGGFPVVPDRNPFTSSLS